MMKDICKLPPSLNGINLSVPRQFIILVFSQDCSPSILGQAPNGVCVCPTFKICLPRVQRVLKEIYTVP
jgi:hypothetical protein